MRTTKRIGYLISAVLLASVLAGCSQSPYGIFASVARERAILDDRNLDNEITVGAMTKAGSTYFLAAGALYYRGEDNPGSTDPDLEAKPDWDTVPAPGTNYTTTSVVTVDFTGTNERVFAVYASPDGLTHGVYEIDVADLEKKPVLRHEITGSDHALGDIFAVNDGLDVWLVVNREGTGTSSWSLYGSANGTDFAEIPGTVAGEPYIDVVADLGSNNVLYLRANAALTETAGVGSTDPLGVAATGRVSPARFTGAHYDSVGGLFWLADNTGHLYSAAAGFAAWTRNGSAYLSSSADNAPVLSFTDFATVPRGTQTILLVGTSGQGYRVVGDTASGVNADDGVSSPSVDGSNYESSALATSTVTSWFVDPDAVTNYPVPTADGEELWGGTLVFAGTPHEGLWRALSSAEGPIQWLRE